MARCALIHKLFDNRHNSQNNFCKYAHLLLCLQQLSHFKVKRVKISKKIMESEFPCNMQIYTLCPKCQSTKFHDILYSGLKGVALTRKTGLMD